MITCLNLISGCVACVMAFNNDYFRAFVLIILAAIFDFLDGFAARALKAYSNIGKELDSLADVISFGVAPGMIIYRFLHNSFLHQHPDSSWIYVSYLAFLIPAFSALRLAKFNIDDRQTNAFIGLPTPADALFWGSSILLLSEYDKYLLYIIPCIIAGIFLFSALMVSEIPMFSLKFKNYGWKGNETRYILMLTALLLFVFFNLSGISMTIVIYILMSLFIHRQLLS